MPVGEESEADRSEGRSKGRRKKRGGERRGCRIRQRPTRLARPRVDVHIGVRPSSREIQLEEGTNQSSEPAGREDRERGPCEIDEVTRGEFRRLRDSAGQGEGQRAATKERVEWSEGRGPGEGDLYNRSGNVSAKERWFRLGTRISQSKSKNKSDSVKAPGSRPPVADSKLCPKHDNSKTMLQRLSLHSTFSVIVLYNSSATCSATHH